MSLYNSATLPACVTHTLASTGTLGHYSITAAAKEDAPEEFFVEASADAITWVTLDYRLITTWADNQTLLFPISYDGYPPNPNVAAKPRTAYKYFRLRILSTDSATLDFVNFELFAYVGTTVTGTGTGSSNTSQEEANQDAYAAATADALSQLNCVQVFTATFSYTAKCGIDVAGAGADVTKIATASSLNSLKEAEDAALGYAKAAAVGSLVCT